VIYGRHIVLLNTQSMLFVMFVDIRRCCKASAGQTWSTRCVCCSQVWLDSFCTPISFL